MLYARPAACVHTQPHLCCPAPHHPRAAAESEEVAGSVPDSGGVYFVPAFGGLLAPWWQDDARGVIVGLTQYSTKVRALPCCFGVVGWPGGRGAAGPLRAVPRPRAALPAAPPPAALRSALRPSAATPPGCVLPDPAAGAHRARDAGGHLLPDARRAGGHGRGRRLRRAGRAARRRRRLAQLAPDAGGRGGRVGGWAARQPAPLAAASGKPWLAAGAQLPPSQPAPMPVRPPPLLPPLLARAPTHVCRCRRTSCRCR